MFTELTELGDLPARGAFGALGASSSLENTRKQVTHLPFQPFGSQLPTPRKNDSLEVDEIHHLSKPCFPRAGGKPPAASAG